MSTGETYSQGGDAKAIKAIANAYYGGYAKMFELNGWPERGDKIIPVVQKRVVETYGSVRAFEEAHVRPDGLMFPMEAIRAEHPNVWLTSFYGFRPETWGFVGFTDNGRRSSFLKHTKPGVLVVIYGAGKAPKDMLGNVVGILQCTHQIGHAEDFCAPAEWVKKQADPERRDKWNFAVKAVRAWRVTPESRIPVRASPPMRRRPRHGSISERWARR